VRRFLLKVSLVLFKDSIFAVASFVAVGAICFDFIFLLFQRMTIRRKNIDLRKGWWKFSGFKSMYLYIVQRLFCIKTLQAERTQGSHFGTALFVLLKQEQQERRGSFVLRSFLLLLLLLFLKEINEDLTNSSK